MTNDVQADGYYGNDDLETKEINLSFLDEDEDSEQEVQK